MWMDCGSGGMAPEHRGKHFLETLPILDRAQLTLETVLRIDCLERLVMILIGFLIRTSIFELFASSHLSFSTLAKATPRRIRSTSIPEPRT